MPTLKKKEVSEEMKAKARLKSEKIKTDLKSDGTLTFIIPQHLEEKLQKEYNFSIDQLRVGGDIPLEELALHIDEHSAIQAHIGMITEFTRHQLEIERDAYELWYERMYYKCKVYLSEKEKGVTEKFINGYIAKKYGKKVKVRRSKVAVLEMQYRILQNVIRASIITKGTLLPTLRNIVQGKDGEGIGKISLKKSKKIRKKLNLIKED